MNQHGTHARNARMIDVYLGLPRGRFLQLESVTQSNLATDFVLKKNATGKASKWISIIINGSFRSFSWPDLTRAYLWWTCRHLCQGSRAETKSRSRQIARRIVWGVKKVGLQVKTTMGLRRDTGKKMFFCWPAPEKWRLGKLWMPNSSNKQTDSTTQLKICSSPRFRKHRNNNGNIIHNSCPQSTVHPPVPAEFSKSLLTPRDLTHFEPRGRRWYLSPQSSPLPELRQSQ